VAEVTARHVASLFGVEGFGVADLLECNLVRVGYGCAFGGDGNRQPSIGWSIVTRAGPPGQWTAHPCGLVASATNPQGQGIMTSG